LCSIFHLQTNLSDLHRRNGNVLSFHLNLLRLAPEVTLQAQTGRYRSCGGRQILLQVTPGEHRVHQSQQKRSPACRLRVCRPVLGRFHEERSFVMAKMIFVNLPVGDLAAATAFYESIGAEKNEQFCDGSASCMVLSETIFVMLLTHEHFTQFTPKK